MNQYVACKLNSRVVLNYNKVVYAKVSLLKLLTKENLLYVLISLQLIDFQKKKFLLRVPVIATRIRSNHRAGSGNTLKHFPIKKLSK